MQLTSATVHIRKRKEENTHINKVKPKVMGIKICLAGTGLIWKTFWL